MCIRDSTWAATDVAVAHGGTGSSTESGARTNLGVAIGSDVQAYDADLAAIAGLTSAADKGIQFTGSGAAATYDLTAAGKALLDDADASAQRTTLGLGTSAVRDLIDEDDMSSDSAVAVPSQQSVKAYVDAQVTAQDFDFSCDSGGALSIDLDSEAMTFTGGTGIDTTGSSNDVSFAIDATVCTLVGAQTLTNKVLTSPDINTPDIDGGAIDGAIIGAATPAAATVTTLAATSAVDLKEVKIDASDSELGFDGLTAHSAGVADGSGVFMVSESSALKVKIANSGSGTAADARQLCGFWDGGKLVGYGPVEGIASGSISIGDTLYLSGAGKVSATAPSSTGEVKIRAGFAMAAASDAARVRFFCNLGTPTTRA
jgi:hypothetical protein